ncbi:MAG: potassium channel family protein [Bacillota bacterium]
MSRQYAVIGLGRFGTSLARTLWKLGQEVLAIDTDEERLRYISEEVTHTLLADTTDINVLKSIGIANFDVVVVAIGEMNIQASVFTTLLLKELGVPYVVVKALNRTEGRVLEKVGADLVVYPEREMGKRVAHDLVAAKTANDIADYIDLPEGFKIIETLAIKNMIGKSLGDLNIRGRYNVNVILVKKASGEVLFSPGPDDIIEAGDLLVVAGKQEDVKNFEQIWD